MSSSGWDSSSSSAAVAWPAMTRSLSNGWINVAPSPRARRRTAPRARQRSARRSGSSRRSGARWPASLAPNSRASPPSGDAALPCRIGQCRAVVAGGVRDDAGRASASVSENTAFIAPRALNAPTFWKFSHLKKSRAPVSASSERQESTGVRCTWGAIRACAARIAARSGSAGRSSLRAPLHQLPAAAWTSGKKKGSFHELGSTLIMPVFAMKFA